MREMDFKRTRTLTMNWEGLGDIEDEDRFFESCERISCAVSVDLASSGSDEDQFFDAGRLSTATVPEDSRMSTSSPFSAAMSPNYDVWMAAPGSITERRKRLLQGMGLLENKELVRIASNSSGFEKAVSKKFGNCQVMVPREPYSEESKQEPSPSSPSPSPATPILLIRSRSDGDIDPFSVNSKRRKEELIGNVSKQHLTRTSSALSILYPGIRRFNPDTMGTLPKEAEAEVRASNGRARQPSNSRLGAFFLIKNLDTGKEFIVNEFDEDGMWNRLSDIQTGKQLTMEEFEKSVGYSPVVKELMRRVNISEENANGSERRSSANSYLSKSFRNSIRTGAALLKNIKGVANSVSGFIGDKEKENNSPIQEQKKKESSEWIKVRQNGKSYKEFTALRLCQEVQAHEGSIWAIKFSPDAHYLSSAGEDRVIHVWEVQECEVLSTRTSDEGSISPLQSACSSPDRVYLCESPSVASEKKKKGKNSSSNRKGNPVPDYVYEPETVFSLSEKPICSFIGHQDDVLDLSWSRSQLLLSSSMDKTVRLWDMETKSCLKMFAHNDYVTCLQFNPVDNNYFISGSLDAKVRLWSIPKRKVVDWTDLHEMVTAISYTPDGQGVIIGSHKGCCRMYSIDGCKLSQTSQVDIQNKKKSQAKKITGFEFSPSNPSEVLITSADSRIRILDGSDITHKFKGFRNTSSQIAASFSLDGKYIICASEDSNVYIWKHEQMKNVGGGKGKSLLNIHSHEHFQCRDVSVAVPWPGYAKGEPPPMAIQSKRQSRRSSQPPSSGESPGRDDICQSSAGKRQLPPLPKKNNNTPDRASEEELAQVSRTESGLGDSFCSTSSSSSIRYGDSPFPSWSSSWSLFDSGSQGNQTVQATAWGLVIVTAGLGGELRAYQNFGLPVRVGRQANLF